ncbi:TlpA family protein disulfide reductase [Polymorphospora rubra]|uniref:TlpA family protein disulfide reductase n=1 Tax=Polymorphospora rubra TaxID=338584 RepID=UPI0033C869DF
MTVLLALLAAVALAGCTSGGWEQDCDTTPDGVIECAPDNRPAAPDVAGELLTGGRYDLTQDRGQVVVVNFWGSWCAPCRAEAADLEATYQATKDSGVRFLGINVQDARDKAIAFEEGRVSYPSLFDPASRLALEFEVLPPNTVPATVVLDRDGRIAVVIRKAVRQETLEPIVARIAAERPQDR